METHPDPSRSSVEFDQSNVTRECGDENESDFFITRCRGPAKKRILVVDDNEERQLAVKRALESENSGGFRDLVVELARSGDECLDVVRDVVYGSRTMRTAPSVVLISQDLGVGVGREIVVGGTKAEDDDEDYRRGEQQKVGAKGVMSGVECCAEIRRHGELSCVGEQFLHVVLLTDDRPEYVFDREELDFLENGALFSNESEEFTSSRSSRESVWDTAIDEAKDTWTLAYKNAGVTKTLPNILLDAELLAAVKHMLSHLPVVNH